MSDESQLQVTPKEGGSSLTVSRERSSLIARGSREALMLAKPSPPETEAEAERIFNKWGLSYFDPDYHDPNYLFDPYDIDDCDDWARRWVNAETEVKQTFQELGLAMPPNSLSWEAPLPEAFKPYNNLRDALARAREWKPTGGTRD